MLYKDFIKEMKECPFCINGGQRHILEKNAAFLTYALAPYSKHHLLVIPKRHFVSYTEINAEERDDVDNLLFQGAEILHKLGYKNYTILVREGNEVLKSVPHLHYHIIPNHRIGDLDIDGKLRKIITNDEAEEIMNDVKKVLNT